MKVCFIDPKGVHFGLNNGIAYLASYLKKNNPDVEEIRVFDFNNNDTNVRERMRQVADYDVICFSVKSFFAKEVARMAQRFKKRNNILIAGGSHINVDGRKFLENSKIDVGVFGEGEIALDSILKKGKEKTDGIIYKKNRKVIATKPRERIKNLDSLPFPDYTDFDSFAGKIFNYSLLTSRGCPYNCIFCAIRETMGRKWIGRSPRNVLEELFQAKENYKISRFNVQDDNFAIDLKRAKEICRMLINDKVDLNWGCYSGIRADTVDEELVRMMSRAGCDGIAVGIESGNRQVFDSINKKESLEQIEECVRLFKKYGIKVEGNFIIGLPNSSVKSVRESVDYAKKLKLDSAIFGLLVPFPGTDAYDWVTKEGRWVYNWCDGIPNGINTKVLFETQKFSAEEMKKMYFEANIKSNNYFAFMDEHLPFNENAMNIMKIIMKYDFTGTPKHLMFALKNFNKVYSRIFYKNR